MCDFLLLPINVYLIKFKKVKIFWSELNSIEKTEIYKTDNPATC